MTDESLTLPSLSAQPSRAEVAALLSALKHDWVGILQSIKVGLELLMHEQLDANATQEVLALMGENLERGFAYGRVLERLARQLESQ